MKKIIHTLVCFLIFTSCVNALPLDNAETEQIINLESTDITYNLGIIQNDKIVEKTLKLRNKLDEVLHINDVRATCACLKVETKSKVVQKNGLIEIDIMLDTTGIAENTNIEEFVYILTGSVKYELIRLVIQATIVKF